MQFELPFDEHPHAERFRQFHENNPHVYKLFSRFASEAASRGRERFGARMVWERMRWHVAFETVDDASLFKLNDHYTPFYARMFMSDHPEYPNLFEIRERR